MQELRHGKVSVIGGAEPKLILLKGVQLFRILKICTFILLAGCLQAYAVGYGQKITLNEKEVALTKIFKEIKKQTGFRFFYLSQQMEEAKKVTINVKDASLNEVLQLCFKDQPFGYEVKDNVVVIKEKKSIVVEANKQPLITGDPVTVSGKVTDAQGHPLVGANVKVKGSSVGVTTDNLGRFTIANIDENAVLEISFVGHDLQMFPIKGKNFLTIALVQNQSILDETVVIAYGTSSRRFTTGNIASVKAADIEKQPVQNPLLALQGRVPGVEVTQLTGLNGGGVKVQIQGRNSINSGLDPLIVIDGVPFPTQLSYSFYQEGIVQGGSPLNYINPADIESIDILKDADATAIYGSQASNGAILITTKKGKIGKTKLNFNIQQGWGKVTRRVEMMNTHQYLDMRREAFRNKNQIASSNPGASGTSVYAPDLLFWDTTRYTDWQKELIGGTAQYTSINAGISGGTAAMQYLVGSTYKRQTTVFPGKFDDKVGSLHFNINGSSVNQRLRVQLTGSYMYDQNHLPGIDITSQAVLTEPDAPPLYDDNGTLNWAQNAAGNSTFINPLAYTQNIDFINTTKNLVSSANLSYRILPGLYFRGSVGYTNMQTNIFLPFRLEFIQPERRANAQRQSNFANRNMSSWIIEPQLQYSNKLGKGKIDGLLGTTIRKSSFDYLSVIGFGFSTDLLMKTLNAATSTGIQLSNSGSTRFNALFGRLNYTWDDKYLLSLNARRDGSNKFGDKNKFHNFASIGIGWIFSQEKWLQQNLPSLSFGKLRASYGITGNDQIPDYSYLGVYEISNPTILYQNSIGLNATGIPNPYLQWEETRKLQAGLDLGLIKDRILLGATFVRNRSSNQLVSYVLPSFAGFSAITKNLAALIQNTSWEFTLNTVNIKGRNFTWSSSVNLTIPRNKLISFPGIELTSYSSGTDGVIVGKPLGILKTVPLVGVNPGNGGYSALDKNGNPSSFIVNADMTFLISPLSVYYGGVINTFSWKGFQLDFLFQFVRKKGSRDMYYYNGSQYPGQFYQGASNQPVTVLNRWQKPGDNTPIGLYSTSTPSYFPDASSDAWYSYQASYIRLKNCSLSWQLPAGWLQKVSRKSSESNARLYFQGQNLATITNYSGLDPETMNVSTLPPLQLWTVGVQMEL
jgi:TonB-dependent starch-binding outer membrane protein SusC